jgi:hypothetical protein
LHAFSDKFSAELFSLPLLLDITIWISEIKINFNVIDKLLLEKIKNMIFKNILGVRSKASNLAIQTELGY